jgi:hypothetical protein
MQTIESGLGTNYTAATISEAELGERTCPDTPNRKYPDIVPKGNIPTKLPNRKYPDTKKAVGIFPVGQQEIFRHNFGQQEMSRQQKHCRDISCWAIGNVPTAYYLSEHFLLPNRKYPDRRYCRALLQGGVIAVIGGHYSWALLRDVIALH